MAAVALSQSLTTFLSFSSAAIQDDFEWTAWSKAIGSGLPVTLPIAPPPWRLNVLPSARGPYSGLNDQVGKSVDTAFTVDTECPAGNVSVTPIIESKFLNVPGLHIHPGQVPRWSLRGQTTGAGDGLIAITGREGHILGFGFTGFAGEGRRSAWTGVVPSPPGEVLTIYQVSQDARRACKAAEATAATR